MTVRECNRKGLMMLGAAIQISKSRSDLGIHSLPNPQRTRVTTIYLLLIAEKIEQTNAI